MLVKQNVSLGCEELRLLVGAKEKLEADLREKTMSVQATCAHPRIARREGGFHFNFHHRETRVCLYCGLTENGGSFRFLADSKGKRELAGDVDDKELNNLQLGPRLGYSEGLLFGRGVSMPTVLKFARGEITFAKAQSEQDPKYPKETCDDRGNRTSYEDY